MVEFEIVGNALCLDFANTVSSRPVTRWDALVTAEDAIAWASAVGRPVSDSLAEADGELATMQQFREIVYRVFKPVAHRNQPAPDDLASLIAEYSEAVAKASLSLDGSTFRLSWPGDRTLRTLCYEVAASAVDLLTNGPLDRLGECPSCCWLFLDISKNRQRRWCSMATCGSRDKARRYYARRAI